MSLLKNQRGIALISELLVVALAIGVIMTVVVKVGATKASRASGVDGGVNSGTSTTSPCSIGVGTTANGETIYENSCYPSTH